MRIRRLTRRVLAVAGSAALGAVLSVLALTGVIGQSASAVDLPGVAQQMRVFEQPAFPASAVPIELAEAQAKLPSRAQGRAISGQVRLLARDLGKNSVDLYAFPTDAGVVCVFVAERTHVATCVDSFTPATGNLQWGLYSGIGTPLTVFGLAADSVAEVAVLVAGRTHSAQLTNNSFFWQSADSRISGGDVEALLARQTDGTVVRVDLHLRGSR